MAVVISLTGDGPFAKLNEKLDTILKEVRKMALDQATFDAELADLVSAVDELILAVEAIPQADLTAEGQSVSDAAARVRAALDSLNPSVPTEEPPAEPTA